MSFTDALIESEYVAPRESTAPTELDAEIELSLMKKEYSTPTVCLFKGADSELDHGVFAVKQYLYQFASAMPDVYKGRWVTESIVVTIIVQNIITTSEPCSKKAKMAVDDMYSTTCARLRTLINTHIFEVPGLSEQFPSLLVAKMTREQIVQNILHDRIIEIQEYCDDAEQCRLANFKLQRAHAVPDCTQYCFMFSGYTFMNSPVTITSGSFDQTVSNNPTTMIHEYTMRKLDTTLIAAKPEAANVYSFLTCLIVYGQLQPGKLYHLADLFSLVSSATKIKSVAFESIVETIVRYYTVYSGQRTCHSCAPTWPDGVYFTMTGSHMCITQTEMYGLFPELRFLKSRKSRQHTELEILRESLGIPKSVVFPSIDGSKSNLIASMHDITSSGLAITTNKTKSIVTRKRKR